MRMHWWLIGLLGLGCAMPSTPDNGAELPPPPPPVAGGGQRLLFVGNSLTYTWNVPQLVRTLAVAAGKTSPVIVARTTANYALEDHWNEGTVQRDLREGDYDVVIVQQGPSTLTSSGDHLTQWVRAFSIAATAAGTRVGVFAIAAPMGADFEAGIANYRAAADLSATAFYPASQAWLDAWQLNEAIPLYGADGFHPSRHGAALGAMVIAALIFEIDPATMPNLFPEFISETEIAQLRLAADQAIRRDGRR
jgi:hypothetical protein